jgi:hypothetical protein
MAVTRAEGVSMRMIADRLGRSPSTISRELGRNAATREGKLEYRASTAQWKADSPRGGRNRAKLAEHPLPREHFHDKLSGVIRDGDGNVVGPFASWKAATNLVERTAGGQPPGARSSLLLRPLHSVATRDEREHQWAPTQILSEWNPI